MSVIAIGTFGALPLQVVLSEKHYSEIEITEQPIEVGADVADHAYRKPKSLTLEAVSAVAAVTYNAIVRMQESRKPFSLVTGLYVYRNMLIHRVEADRDTTTGRILSCKIDLREIITVSTSYVPSRTTAAQGNTPGRRGASANNPNGGPTGKPAQGGNGGTAATPPAPETVAPDVADIASEPVSAGDAVATEVQPSILYGLVN